MEKERNFIIMVNYSLSENIEKGKKMGKENNMIKMEKLLLMENIQMAVDGM